MLVIANFDSWAGIGLRFLRCLIIAYVFAYEYVQCTYLKEIAVEHWTLPWSFPSLDRLISNRLLSSSAFILIFIFNTDGVEFVFCTVNFNFFTQRVTLFQVILLRDEYFIKSIMLRQDNQIISF